MFETDKKYPYLTAWVGIMALNSLFNLVFGLLFGLILSEGAIGTIVRLAVQVTAGFFIFKALVERHVIPNVGKDNANIDEVNPLEHTT